MKSAPRDGTPFLIWLSDTATGMRMHTAKYNESQTGPMLMVGNQFGFDVPAPICWMALPEPPEERYMTEADDAEIRCDRDIVEWLQWMTGAACSDRFEEAKDEIERLRVELASCKCGAENLRKLYAALKTGK